MRPLKSRLARWKRCRALFADLAATTEALSWFENRHKGRLRANYETRRDLRRIPVGESVRIEVFWKDLPIGRGPAASVFILEEEILRFDCFGPGDGHMHAALFLPAKGESRVSLPEVSIAAQIDRAFFEIGHNLGYYQARMANPEIRRLQIDQAALTEATAEARELMQRFALLP